MYTALSITIVALLVPAPAVQSEERNVPAVGALVRVVAPSLGAGWHYGMFNRTRTEPPCYLVLTFHSDGTNRIKRTLMFTDINKLQVHKTYDGVAKMAPFTGGKQTWGEQDWREIPVKLLREINRANCDSRNE